MVAALPVIAVGYQEDWSGFYTGPGARPEFAMGEDFVAANGERSFFLFMIARWACIPFSWIGGVVCYLWARDLYGRPAGIVACSIWCFEPSILAHASLMTPDAHATALGLAACYTFWRWLKKPTWSQAALTGVVLGLAELAKTTLILLYPLWPLLWLIYRWPERKRMLASDWLREAGMLVMRMTIGLYILNLGYGFENTLKPLGNFDFVSGVFTVDAQEGKEDSTPHSDGAELTELATSRRSSLTRQNRFAGTWLGNVLIPVPANYLIGIDLQQRDFDNYPLPSYLRGRWSDQGWWYYYLYASTIKLPLGILTLVGLNLAQLVRRLSRRLQRTLAGQRRKSSNPGLRTATGGDELVLLLPAALIFVVVSLKVGFNEHFRYVLPCLPFVFVWISGLATNFQCIQENFVDSGVGYSLDFSDADKITTNTSAISSFSSLATRNGIYVVLLLWSACSSVWIYPHSISYFNEIIRGPRNGSRHLLGSNVDWGQDFRYLLWIKSHDGLAATRVAFHGSFDPFLMDDSLGGAMARTPHPQSQQTYRFNKSTEANPPVYAVSVNIYNARGSKVFFPGGKKERLSQDFISMLRSLKVRSSVGYSITLASGKE
jgi:4-amino-4-deoxy-L-arabinose transferase-like glycosyltransferase